MEHKSYHIIAKSDGRWNVKKTGAERALGSFSTKREAITTAKRLVTKSGGGELIIHREDGRVSRRNSYGNNSNSKHNKKGRVETDLSLSKD